MTNDHSLKHILSDFKSIWKFEVLIWIFFLYLKGVLLSSSVINILPGVITCFIWMENCANVFDNWPCVHFKMDFCLKPAINKFNISHKVSFKTLHCCHFFIIRLLSSASKSSGVIKFCPYCMCFFVCSISKIPHNTNETLRKFSLRIHLQLIVVHSNSIKFVCHSKARVAKSIKLKICHDWAIVLDHQIIQLYSEQKLFYVTFLSYF